MAKPHGRTTAIRQSDQFFEQLEARIVLAVIDGLPSLAALEDPLNSVVVFETSLGSVYIELFSQDAPQTVQNFLNYVDRGLYGQSLFHRSQPGFVLQGGGFAFNDDLGLQSVHAEDLGPVPNEFGRPNLARTIAMAQQGGNINSATTQFFFNLVDNSAILDPQQFAVFGQVATNDSWNVIQQIVGLNIEDLRNDPAFADQLVDREGNLLFRDGQGFLTTVDTGTAAFGNTAMGSTNFSLGGFPVLPGFSGGFESGDEVQIFNAQVVKPDGTTAFYDQLVVYPEGFRSPNIFESIELVNPNSTAADYQVVVRYENGLRDEVISVGVLDAFEKRTIVLHDPTQKELSLVRPFNPYAIEVYSAVEDDAGLDMLGQERHPVAASLNHIDFGGALGESFRNVTGEFDRSTSWDFPNIPMGPTDFPFLIWQNFGSEATTVTVTFFRTGAASFSKQFDLDGYRRGGVALFNSVDELAGLPAGTIIGARVQATTPIVAALSAYRSPNGIGATDGSAEGTLGVPFNGSLEGAVAGVLVPANGSTTVTALNTTGNAAVVTLRAHRSDGSILSVTPAPFIMAAQTRAQVSLGTVFPTIPTGEIFTITYTSTTPVALAVSAASGTGGADPLRLGAAFSTEASLFAHFADGHSAFGDGGTSTNERISVWNPYANQSINVTLSFHFSDGTRIQHTLQTLAALRRTDVNPTAISSVLNKINSAEEFQTYAVSVHGSAVGTAESRHVVASLLRLDNRGLLALTDDVLSAPTLDGSIEWLTSPIFDPGTPA